MMFMDSGLWFGCAGGVVSRWCLRGGGVVLLFTGCILWF